MVITLIGYRGSGKSCVGRHVAEALGWEFADADVEVERRAGKTIRDIFADDGESVFRDLEEQTVADLLTRDRLVLAAGGGAILRETTRQRMQAAGPVVWLRADPATLQARITGDATSGDRRPDLTAAGGLDEVRTLLAAREPLYRETATLELSSEELPPEEIAARIVAALAPAEGGAP